MAELPELREILNHELREATRQTEELLDLEDQGWLRLGATDASSGVSDAQRKDFVAQARVYGARDPLAVQAIRLWTSYTLGSGIVLNVKDERAKEVLGAFWKAQSNLGVLSPAGQRKSSDRTLIDGEIFFAVFVDARGNARIRRIDPLEITAFITDTNDAEDVKFYQRSWTNAQGETDTVYYRSAANLKNEPAKGSDGQMVSSTGVAEDGVVFHMAINSIGQRGNSLLLPALEWIRLHRRFLASRAAIMLALARFAWKGKVKGGQAAVDTLRNALHDDSPEAGSVWVENEGVDLTPYSPGSQAMNAYNDARMLKLQVFAAVGWPEQYFGDLRTGNLATAQSVELPVQKMCETYQDSWASTYDEINRYVLAQSNVPEAQRQADIDFPAISPEDAGILADSIQKMVGAFPEFADSRDVMQQGLEAIGVDEVTRVLDELLGTGDATTESAGDIRKAKTLIRLAEIVKELQPDASENGHRHEEGDVRLVRGQGVSGV